MEKWADIPGLEGRYMVSNMGRIRSVGRFVRTMKRNGDFGERFTKEKVLSQQLRSGYPQVTFLDADGNRLSLLVHRLVAKAFVPNPLGLPEVNHIDANTQNPVAENLEWVDKSGNISHAYAIGRRPVGDGHHFSRLPRDSGGHCLAESGV